MAHEPKLPSEPRDPHRTHDRPHASPTAPDRIHRPSDRTTALLDPHSAATPTPDPRLQKIVERACLATCSTGAAIALARGNEFICYATTGATAPDLGVRLNIDSGLSAACVQSGEVQRCDDSEIDPRVDAAICRQLGVRAVLIFPIFHQNRLLGVFEVFSPTPRAFSDRDAKTLHSLSEQLLEDLGAKPAVANPPPSAPKPVEAATPAPVPPSRSELVPKVAVQVAEKVEPPPEQEESHPDFKLVQSQRDYSTVILTVLIIVVALLLGWMLGRVGWRSGRKAERANVAAVTPQPQNTEPANDAGDLEEIVIQPSAIAPSQPLPKSKDKNPDGLVVYEKGKVIFQVAPQKSPRSSKLADAPESSPSEPLQVPPEIADTYLLRRIEPQYPERARQQHIQGPVVLQARVGEDGVVQQLRVLTGDAQLAVAAIDAVRRWHFKPYAPNGRPVEFETRITLNFTLPGQSDSERNN